MRLLGPHLTAENHGGVLEAARGKRKSEVEEIVARLAPRPDVAPSVRKLPATSGAPGATSGSIGISLLGMSPVGMSPIGLSPVEASSAGSPDGLSSVAVSPSSGSSAGASPVGAPVSKACSEGPEGNASTEARARAQALRVLAESRHGVSAEVTPISPDRYRYQLTIGGSTLEKLRLAKDMLRHALPSGDDEALLDRALGLLLDDLARKKFGSDAGARRSGTPPSGSRHVPAAVKRAVWVRDLGRCAFVSQDGRRCGERAFVEFHHLRPFAAGGEATVENIQLRCRRHNGYEARLFFPRPEDRAFVPERNRRPSHVVRPGPEVGRGRGGGATPGHEEAEREVEGSVGPGLEAT